MKSKNTTKTSASEKSQKTDESTSIRIQPKLAEWDLEDAVRTLARAEEIKQDEELMGKIKPMLQKKVKSIEAIKQLYNDKYNKPSQMEAEEGEDEDEDND